VVDDQAVNIQALYQAFSADHQVLMATGGEQALKLAAGQQPDLILLDVVMPGLDGHEVCRRLKADGATRDIPVIFVTAHTDEGRDAGAGAGRGGLHQQADQPEGGARARQDPPDAEGAGRPAAPVGVHGRPDRGAQPVRPRASHSQASSRPARSARAGAARRSARAGAAAPPRRQRAAAVHVAVLARHHVGQFAAVVGHAQRSPRALAPARAAPFVADGGAAIARRRAALAQVVAQAGPAHRQRRPSRAASAVQHQHQVHAGVDLGVVLGPLRHAPQAVHLGQQPRQRAAVAQHLEHAAGARLHQAARQLLPHALGHQRVHLAVGHHARSSACVSGAT
jgi:CheY-like chemotaxis protein